MESLLTEIVVALLLRTRRPFYKSRPGKFVLVSSCVVGVVGILVPFLPVSKRIGFAPLPAVMVVALLLITALYALAVELNKARFYRRAERSAAGTRLATEQA